MESSPIGFDLKQILTLGRFETPGIHVKETKRGDGVIRELYSVDEKGQYSGTTGLVFGDKKGNHYDLLQGLPPNTRVENYARVYPHSSRDQKMRGFSGQREVLTFGDLEQPGGLITFLHEKGHVIAIDRGLHPENTKEGNPLEAYKDKFPMLTEEELHREGRELGNYLRFEYRPPSGILMVTHVPREVVMEAVRYYAHREKVANALMEKEFREIRDMGVNMELQAAPSPDDITNLILIQLHLYGVKMPLAFQPLRPEAFNASEITNIFTDGKDFTPVNIGIFKKFLQDIQAAVKQS